jgi:hypothetical protein
VDKTVSIILITFQVVSCSQFYGTQIHADLRLNLRPVSHVIFSPLRSCLKNYLAQSRRATEKKRKKFFSSSASPRLCARKMKGTFKTASKRLFVAAVFPGEVNHSLDIFRLCLIEKRAIADDETTAFASSVDEFLAVDFHFIGCG